MTLCHHCGEPNHLGTDAHPCCARFWNGAYCHSCEASKRHQREQTSKPRRTA